MIVKEKKRIPLYMEFGLFTEAPTKNDDNKVVKISSERDKDYTDDADPVERVEVDNTGDDDDDYTPSDDDTNDDDANNDNAGNNDSDDDTNDAQKDESDDENNNGSNKETIEVNDSSDEDEDYTDDVDDGGGDEGDEGANDSSSGGEGEEEAESIDKSDMRKFSLYKRYINLYQSIDYIIPHLESIVSDDPLYSSALAESLNMLRKMSSIMKDYMILKFESDSYLQNSFFFEKIKTVVLTSIEILKTNEIKRSTQNSEIKNVKEE